MSKALLLIHGFLTCTDDWDLFVPELEKMYDEVVLFKQPGHERSDGKPHYKDFTADGCFAALDETIAELEEKFDVVDVMGHSMGGGMGLYAAAKLKNIGRAVLLAPAVRFPRPGAMMRHNALVSKLEGMAKSCSDKELAEALTDAVASVKSTYKESLDVFFKRLLPNWSPHNLLTFMRIMGKAEKFAAEVTCPLAVCWGELDEFVPRKSAEFILENAKSRDKTYIVYETVGHAMMYLGNIRLLLRDVKCLLSGEDPCELPYEAGALRTAVRITDNGDGSVELYTVADKLVRDKGGVREIRESTRRTERRSPSPQPQKQTETATVAAEAAMPTEESK